MELHRNAAEILRRAYFCVWQGEVREIHKNVEITVVWQNIFVYNRRQKIRSAQTLAKAFADRPFSAWQDRRIGV